MSSMTPLLSVVEALEAAMPSSRVLAELARIIWKECGSRIELQDRWVTIPALTPMTVVTKAFLLEYFDRPFKTGFKVIVGVGPVKEDDNGLLSAQYCFATMHYNKAGEFLTVDFHGEMI